MGTFRISGRAARAPPLTRTHTAGHLTLTSQRKKLYMNTRVVSLGPSTSTEDHKDFARGNAADAHRTSRVRRVTLRTRVKVSSNFIHGVTHNHHERGSVAAAHVDTAAAMYPFPDGLLFTYL